MLPYLIISLLISILSFKESSRGKRLSKIYFFTISSILIFFMSLRTQIGCDTISYKRIFSEINNVVDYQKDFGFNILVRVSSYLGGSFEFFIFISSLIFLIPVLIFCHNSPRPFLALNIAFSYLITVIGFGFLRQGIAIAFFMLGALMLEKSYKFYYFIVSLVSLSFHRTSIITLIPGSLVPLGGNGVNKLKNYLYAAILFTTLIVLFLYNFEKISWYIWVYVHYELQNNLPPAKGAIFLLSLNAIPGAIYLLNYQKFQLPNKAKKFWIILSIGSLLSFPMLLLLKATATYRLSLYLIPIQVYIGSRLPDLELFSISKNIWELLIISFSFITLLTWLSFANHASCWVPYQNIFL